MVSHWSLSDSKSPLVSRTLFNILADLNNVVVWMVSIRTLISKSSSLCINPLVTVPKEAITIGITVSFTFYSFFQFPSKVQVLILQFYSDQTAKSTTQQVLFFLLVITRSDRLAEIRSSVYISKSQRSLCISFSRIDSGLCIYHLFIWPNFNFLHNAHPVVSSLILFLC